MCLGEVPYHLFEKVEINDQRRFSTGVSKMQQPADGNPSGLSALTDQRAPGLLRQPVGLTAQTG
jgi:hypothetical protein